MSDRIVEGSEEECIRGGRRSAVYNPEAYRHARNLRTLLRVQPEAVAGAMGLVGAELAQLEQRDVIFWNAAQLRAYGEALGFTQWLVMHQDGRRAHVIAESERMAALEASWQPSDCASIKRVPEAGEWRIETLSRLWTVRQAAAFLDVSPRSLHELVADGSLPHVDLEREPGNGPHRIGLAPEHIRQHGAERSGTRSPRPLGPSPMGPHDEMIRGVRRLAIWLARKYWRRSLGTIEFDDLRQEADLALLDAAESFQPAGGKKFSSYALVGVRWRLQLYFDQHASTVRVPVHRQDLRRAELMRSLDAPLRDDTSTTLLDLLRPSDDNSSIPRGNLSAVIAAAIDALPRRWREVLLEHEAQGATLEEIGQKLGVTRERVRVIKERALERVRQAIVRAEARRVSVGAPRGALGPASEAPKSATPEGAPARQPRPRAPRWEEVKVALVRLRRERLRARRAGANEVQATAAE